MLKYLNIHLQLPLDARMGGIRMVGCGPDLLSLAQGRAGAGLLRAVLTLPVTGSSGIGWGDRCKQPKESGPHESLDPHETPEPSPALSYSPAMLKVNRGRQLMLGDEHHPRTEMYV